MSDVYTMSGESPTPAGRSSAPVVIHNHVPKQPWLGRTFVKVLLGFSLLGNLALFGMYQQYYPGVSVGEVYKSGDKLSKNKIAVIKVEGIITPETVAAPKKDLKRAQEDDDVKAVVLEVESPGGTISGSDELYHAIVEFKEKSKKPVVVSMREVAASGGYYISAPADKIVADRSCMTGSIGVISSLFNAEKLVKDWGIQPEVFKSGPMKDSGSFLRAMTPEEREVWQNMIKTMYEQFLGVILKHRSEKVGGEQKLRTIADGRIYIATEALKLGLIDQTGYLDDAVSSAKELAKVSGDVRVVTYRRPSGFFAALEGDGALADPAKGWSRQLAHLAAPRLWLLPPSMAGVANLLP